MNRTDQDLNLAGRARPKSILKVPKGPYFGLRDNLSVALPLLLPPLTQGTC